MDQKNFVEWGYPQFSDRAIEAARRGHLNAEPLLDLLQKTHDVSRALEQIFKIAQENRFREFAWDVDDSLEPPMSPNTIESLLALGQVASAILESAVGRISTWLEKHGIREPATDDLAIAARASVTRSPTKNATNRETEHA